MVPHEVPYENHEADEAFFMSNNCSFGSKHPKVLPIRHEKSELSMESGLPSPVASSNLR